MSHLNSNQFCIKNVVHIVWKFWHFPTIIVFLKLNSLVTLFDRKLQIFKKSPKLTIFGLFNELLFTQNVNVARFVRNVEWDFFCDFQTLCVPSLSFLCLLLCPLEIGQIKTWKEKINSNRNFKADFFFFFLQPKLAWTPCTI